MGCCAAPNEFLMDAFYCLSVSGSALCDWPQSVPRLRPLLLWRRRYNDRGAGRCLRVWDGVGGMVVAEGKPASSRGGGAEIPGGFEMDISMLRFAC